MCTGIMVHVGDADEKHQQLHQNSSLPVSVISQCPSPLPPPQALSTIPSMLSCLTSSLKTTFLSIFFFATLVMQIHNAGLK